MREWLFNVMKVDNEPGSNITLTDKTPSSWLHVIQRQCIWKYYKEYRVKQELAERDEISEHYKKLEIEAEVTKIQLQPTVSSKFIQ